MGVGSDALVTPGPVGAYEWHLGAENSPASSGGFQSVSGLSLPLPSLPDLKGREVETELFFKEESRPIACPDYHTYLNHFLILSLPSLKH